MKIAALAALFFVIGAEACSSSRPSDEICENKISYSLQSRLSGGGDDDPINIIVTLNDTTGLRAEFPSLRIANGKIALGHLTRGEIFSLCRRNNVVHIEIPKTLYPTK